MSTLTATRTIDHRGRTITTFVVYDAAAAMEAMEKGETLEIITEDFDPFRADIAAWCRATGHRLIETKPTQGGLSFLVEKGSRRHRRAPLFPGPRGSRSLERLQTEAQGWARPFSRFAAAGMAKTGHIPAQEKLQQLRSLGAHLYACGGSLDHFKVKTEDFIFHDIPVIEYLTFMSVMEDADIQLYI